MSKSNEPIDLAGMRHSCAHVLAQAVLTMFPEAKLGIGPAIDDGFYYDFELPRPLTPEDFPELEKKMKYIIKQAQKFAGREVTGDEATSFLQEKDQRFKVELAKEFAEKGEKLTFYENVLSNGQIMFTDLCRGGHMEHTGKIGPFKLMKTAGAYWRGDEKNPMLQRIYGTCWATQAELDEYLQKLEEAKKRDHKILGKQLGLFTFSPLVGAGYPMFLPKGATIKKLLEDYITSIKKARDFKFVCIPHLAKEELYVRSGHLGKYDAMMPIMETTEGERMVMKPMNCPHHFELFNSQPHSYKELPLRFAENTAVYRYEKSGEVNGLFRVRSITQDDTHIFVTHDQIESEIEMILGLVKELYDKFGFEKFKARISVRDPKNKEKYFGSDEVWQKAEEKLVSSVQKWTKDYFIGEGEAAFYGPKIDVMVEDALGREWQLSTVQLDFNQPENFDMNYTGEDGKPHRPAVLHVAVFGSVERFLGIVLEHYAGALPVWLAPVQAMILPVSEAFNDYAREVEKVLKANDIRYEIDDANDSLGKKIRNAEMTKVPYMLVIGEKEVTDKAVAVRDHGSKNQEVMSLDAFVAKIKKESQY
ncbi:MAG: threonine--tRNA ligase [Patescibacteria group bacterium]